jgi:hypothetical protein
MVRAPVVQVIHGIGRDDIWADEIVVSPAPSSL